MSAPAHREHDLAGLNLLGNDTSTEPVSDIRISEYAIQIALVDDGHIRAQALHDIVKTYVLECTGASWSSPISRRAGSSRLK